MISCLEQYSTHPHRALFQHTIWLLTKTALSPSPSPPNVWCSAETASQILVFVQGRSIAQHLIAVAGPGLSSGCWDFVAHLLWLNMPATVTESPSVLNELAAQAGSAVCAMHSSITERQQKGESERATERGGFNCRVGRASYMCSTS